jgi:hypothetical protein
MKNYFDTVTLNSIIRELEQRFNLTHIGLFEVFDDGRLLFTCQENSKPSLLTIDKDAWVLIKNNDSQFWDVLGGM